MEQHAGSPAERLAQLLADNLHGVEIDASLVQRCLRRIENEFGPLPAEHHLVQGDFFRHEFNTKKGSELLFGERTSKNSSDPFFFDLILGNPPFGGTFDARIEDQLDRTLGVRCGCKIKKETYAFFLVKCVERLKPAGGSCSFAAIRY